jgi:hydroxypyruvate reductase
MLDLQQLARQIFHRTLAAIDVPQVMRTKLQLQGSRLRCSDSLVLHSVTARAHLHGTGRITHAAPLIDPFSEIDLREFDRLRVIAFGKAAHSMVAGLQTILPPELNAGGIVSAPTPPQIPLPGWTYFVAGHPIPNAASLEAGRAILALLQECDEGTLIFFLISGGGSSLVELPLDAQITLKEIQELNRALVTCGAPIDDINTVRKHFSAVKGGRLAAASPRAMKITYAVTDVPAGKESALASGPTIPDPTTRHDLERVVSEFGLRDKLPPRIRELLTSGTLLETPKPGDPAFARAQFHILLCMHDLFHAAHRCSEALGFITICDNTTDDWTIARATDYLLEQLAQLKRSNPGRRIAVIADGEISSPVTGNGVGGRNSAFVLDCVSKIAGRQIAVLSAGTDGVDGVSPAAGAVADGETLARAASAGLDPADFFLRCDSYTFFKSLDGVVVTGPTGNNLRDLRIFLAEGSGA